MKYFLFKKITETTRFDDESLPYIKSWIESGPTVNTKEEMEEWVKKEYVKDYAEPYAIKGVKIKFKIKRKVEIEIESTSIEDNG